MEALTGFRASCYGHRSAVAEINLAKKLFPAARLALDRTWMGLNTYSSRYHKTSAEVAALEGDYNKAIKEYGYFTTNAMAVNGSYFQTDALFYIEVASRLGYYLGQIYEKMGDPAKAADHYRKFLDLMKNADPGIKEIDDARSRVSKK